MFIDWLWGCRYGSLSFFQQLIFEVLAVLDQFLWVLDISFQFRAFCLTFRLFRYIWSLITLWRRVINGNLSQIIIYSRLLLPFSNSGWFWRFSVDIFFCKWFLKLGRLLQLRFQLWLILLTSILLIFCRFTWFKRLYNLVKLFAWLIRNDKFARHNFFIQFTTSLQ